MASRSLAEPASSSASISAGKRRDGRRDLRRARRDRRQRDAPAVGGIGPAHDVAGALEPVDDAGHGAAREPGQLREPAGREAGIGDHELQAAEVGRVHAEVVGEGLIERGRPEGLTDRREVVHHADILAPKRLRRTHDPTA